MDKEAIQLSDKAFNELKELARDELDNDMPDDDIKEIGLRLLNLFSVFTTKKEEPPKPEESQFTDLELKVLRFLHDEICHKKRSPTVREIAKVIGLKSSRSGFRFLNTLVSKGLVVRSDRGQLLLRWNAERMHTDEHLGTRILACILR
jgi:hypothetical protein